MLSMKNQVAVLLRMTKRIYSPAPIAEAFHWADRWQLALSIQNLSLDEAAGYGLAADLFADSDIPPQALCARDGYALLSADTLGAGDYNPLPLRLVPALSGVTAGSAVRVSAGDALPAGADAVLGLEQADLRDPFLDVAGSLAPGDGVIQAGEESRRGELLLSAGRRLRPQDLARLALAGQERVEVRPLSGRTIHPRRGQPHADGPGQA